MMLSVNALTNAVNAVPMTTATARSTILPRERNSLNPLNIGRTFLDWTGLLQTAWRTSGRYSVQGQGYRLTQRRARHRVRHPSRQRNQHYAVIRGGPGLFLGGHQDNHGVGGQNPRS